MLHTSPYEPYDVPFPILLHPPPASATLHDREAKQPVRILLRNCALLSKRLTSSSQVAYQR